jgi:hypothetical protein
VPPKRELQGRTDQYIGSWLAGRTRQDVILASKVGQVADIIMRAVVGDVDIIYCQAPESLLVAEHAVVSVPLCADS